MNDETQGEGEEVKRSDSVVKENNREMGKEQMVLKQAKKYENMLNSCLIDRLTEETRF